MRRPEIVSAARTLFAVALLVLLPNVAQGQYGSLQRRMATDSLLVRNIAQFDSTARFLDSGVTPFTVVSTVKVANLNADLFDGQTGTWYVDSANFTGTDWTDLTDAGETALHIHDSMYYTETELDAGQLDNRYFTETESDARFSPIAGSASIVTVGTIGTGTWQGDIIDSAYIDQSLSVASLTASGTVQAEHLYSTDDAVIDGSVGIGTASPGSLLHLNTATATSVTLLTLESDINNANEYNEILFKVTGGVNYGAIRSHLGSVNDSYMTFSTTTDGGSLVQHVTIQHDGKIGFGTKNPGQDVEIYSSSPQLRIRDSGSTAGSTTGFVEFGGTDGGVWNRTGYIGDGSASNSNLYFQAEDGDLLLGDSSGTVMYLQGGKVGILDSTPSYELDVTGAGRFTTDFIVGDDLFVQNTIEMGGRLTLSYVSTDLKIGYDYSIISLLKNTEITGTLVTSSTLQIAGTLTGVTNLTMSGTLDLGTNTITDGNLTGAWTGITNLTATGLVQSGDLEVNNSNELVAKIVGTNAARARFFIDGNTSGADAQISFAEEASTKWSIGRDDTDNSLKISQSHQLETNVRLTIMPTTGNIVAIGSIQAEHLYSTDDIVADGLATIGETLTTGGHITLNAAAGGADTYLLFQNNSGSIGVIGSDAAIGGGDATDLSIYAYGANDILFWTNSATRLTIDGAGTATFGGNITGPDGESTISGFKNIRGRAGDGILHIKPGVAAGPIFIQYDTGGTVSFFQGATTGVNPFVYIYGYDTGASAVRWGSHKIATDGSYYIGSQESMYMLASAAFVVHTGGGQNAYMRFGGTHYWQDIDAGSATRMSLESTTGKLWLEGELEIDGALNHDGSTAGFFGTTPIARERPPFNLDGIFEAMANLGLIDYTPLDFQNVDGGLLMRIESLEADIAQIKALLLNKSQGVLR